MGAYQKHLWDKVLPALQTAPPDIRQECLNAHAEAMTLSKHQTLSARHATDVAAKSLNCAITLRRHAWLRASGIVEDVRKQIEEQAFDTKGLFNEKTDDSLKSIHESKKTAKSYTIHQQPRFQRQQWQRQFPQPQYHQQGSQTFHPFRASGNRSSQQSSVGPAYKQQPSHKHQTFRPPSKKSRQFL